LSHADESHNSGQNQEGDEQSKDTVKEKDCRDAATKNHNG